MRDVDIRMAVRTMLALEHPNSNDTRIVEEMGIWSGSVRIDIAVINGQLIGYELKSERDNLERLPVQAALYSRVFDKVSLVVAEKHAAKARLIVPEWWGVILARRSGLGVKLQKVRRPKTNPSPDRMLVAQLLWRDEALAILEALDLAKGWRSKSAGQLHARLASALSFADLSYNVRETLKSRSDWLGQVASN